MIHLRIMEVNTITKDCVWKSDFVNIFICFGRNVQFHSDLAEDISIQLVSDPQAINKITSKYWQNHHIVFVADLSCHDFTINTIKMRKYFRAPFRWLIVENNINVGTEEVVPEPLSQIELLPDSEVYVARNVNNIFEVHLMYKSGHENHWKLEKYGKWSKETGLVRETMLGSIVAMRRLDLEGVELATCFVLTDSDSINHLMDGVNDHVDTITKVNFPTINHLLDFVNARRKYVFTNTWGYKENGSWNGLTGYLLREEAEIGGSPMFFTSERVPIVDFVSSPTPTTSKFVFQSPKLSYENNLFLLSFRATVWFSSIALVALMFIALVIVTRWEWNNKLHKTNIRELGPTILRPNITDVGIMVFGAVCQQGSSAELKGSLGRAVMLVVFLSLMFLYTSYSANIVALLQSSSSQIKTLEDLLHSRISFGVHDNVFNRYYFSTATEPVRKAIYETKVAPRGSKPHFMSMEDGVKNIRKGLFAFHMETGVGYKFVGKYFHEGEKCGLTEIEYLQANIPWLAVRKNTPYKEMFKIGTKRIIEHGIQCRENRLKYEKQPKCTDRSANFVSVSMVDCYPALLVLTYGTLLALAVFVIEILKFEKAKYLKKYLTIHKKY